MAPRKQRSLLQLQRDKLKQQKANRKPAAKPTPKASKPAPKALPPGKKGGPLAKTQKALPPGKKGGAAVSGGAKPKPTSSRVTPVKVRDLGTAKPKPISGSNPKALPPGNRGGQLARVARTAASTAGKVGAAGKILPVVGTLLTAAGEVSAMADRQKRWAEYKKANGLEGRTPGRTENRTNRPGGNRTRTSNNTSSPTTPSGTRSRRGAAAATRPTPKPTSALQGRVGNANVDELRRGQEDTRKAQLERANRGNGRTQSGGGSTQSRSGGTSRPSAPAPRRQPASAPAAKPRFKGSAEEGRKMWAEKYSSSKYDGQAIQKEAKKLLEEMKKRRESKSSASKAGWDGNKNY